MEKYKILFRSYYAPILYDYVSWVIEDARKRKIKKLYFLSRDGYLMYLVAERILSYRKIEDISISYLKVSRYSLRSAQYYLLGEKSLDYICINGIDVTFRKILIRAGLSKEQQEAVVETISIIKLEDIDRVLSRSEIKKVKRILSGNTIFWEYLNNNSKIAYENTIGYLRQEGVDNNEEIAIVDSGWVGSIQESIRQLLEISNLQGYYFGLYETPRGVEENSYHSYYFGPKSTRGLMHDNYADNQRKVHFSNCLFEAIYSSPEGMCLGYKKEDNRYISIDGRENPNKLYMNAAYEVMKDYVYCEKNYGKCFDLNEELIVETMSYPSLEDVNVLENLQFCDDVIEYEYQSIVRPWSINDVKKNTVLYRIFNKMFNPKYIENTSGWPEGSIVRCGYKVDYYLKQERLYKKLMYIRKAIKR
ncbi:MAG TPA: hypothetical protein DCR12_07430 [Lachnospiraceae bacterium]|nr:hypothetical protein [Lachnospiraceae bacterium]